MSTTPRWRGGEPLNLAFSLACEYHADKTRKTDDTPYIAHLMAVSALVTEHGGSQTQAAAALLHDIIEDTAMTHDRLTSEVGPAIADIVLECTDDAERGDESKMTREERLADWRRRKNLYLDQLAKKPDDAASLLVVLADKVHNGEATARDIQRCRDAGREIAEFWSHFNAPRENQQWWYGQLLAALESKTWPDVTLPLLARFRAAVGVIQSA
jgi:(p)ppGpp synthase/HD superfamily hydrolase